MNISRKIPDVVNSLRPDSVVISRGGLSQGSLQCTIQVMTARNDLMLACYGMGYAKPFRSFVLLPEGSDEVRSELVRVFRCVREPRTNADVPIEVCIPSDATVDDMWQRIEEFDCMVSRMAHLTGMRREVRSFWQFLAQENWWDGDATYRWRKFAKHVESEFSS